MTENIPYCQPQQTKTMSHGVQETQRLQTNVETQVTIHFSNFVNDELVEQIIETIGRL